MHNLSGGINKRGGKQLPAKLRFNAMFDYSFIFYEIDSINSQILYFKLGRKKKEI